MAGEKYHLTKNDRDFIGRTLKELKGRGRGEVPTPQRRRGVNSGGGTTLRRARVYGGSISAATGNLTADWGSGEVKFMNDATGVLDADTTTVDNLWDETFLEDAMVSINTAFDPPRVEYGGCSAFSTWE